jgi:hypothetical protein
MIASRAPNVKPAEGASAALFSRGRVSLAIGLLFVGAATVLARIIGGGA